MKCGGNQLCNDYLQKYTGMDPLKTPIKEKYDNPIAQHYTTTLKCRVEGMPEPDPICTEESNVTSLKGNILSQSSFAETTASSITDDDGALSDDSTKNGNKYSNKQQHDTKTANTTTNNPSTASWSDSVRSLIPPRLLMTSFLNRGTTTSRRSFRGTKNFESL